MNVSESNAVFALLAWIGQGTRWRRRPTAAEAGEALGFLGVRAGQVLQHTADPESIRAAVERFALEVGESADLPDHGGEVAFFGASRAAEAGERCSCGRQAVVVFSADSGRETGYCGRSGAARLVPCVFCGATERHPGMCPRYRLNPVLATDNGGRAE